MASSARTPRSRRLNNFIELLGSMRFAVSLLTFICLASVVGTVLVQNQALSNYLNQFGPFWYEVFDKFSLYTVYNAWWFLLIMGFLVVSTTLCVLKTSPKLIKDMRSYRDNLRERSLQAISNHAAFTSSMAPSQALAAVRQLLQSQGYRFREKPSDSGTLVAAKRGSSNRLGYIFAHTAIVIICVGGLLDSELPVRLQMWMGGKQPVVENMAIADVPSSGRLNLANPSYRANVLIPEGGRTGNAVVLVDDGALVQPLPFTLELDTFIVEYYSTGMPRLFASEVKVTDHITGETFAQTIKVNEPLRYRGVTVYQSSFDDGGSKLRLLGHALRGSTVQQFEVQGVVGESSTLVAEAGGEHTLSLEFSAFRPFNVENFANNFGNTERKGFAEHVASVAGSAARRDQDKDLVNVGPSFQYKLRDDSGQAIEFNNYMMPLELDGRMYYLTGLRERPDDEFRYMRIPADDNTSMRDFLALRAALNQPAARRQAALQFARQGMEARADVALTQQLADSAERALETFAREGLQGIARFLEGSVPDGEQQRAADVVIRLLGGAMAELRNVARTSLGQEALNPLDPDGMGWVQAAIVALSDLHLYPSPVLLMLEDFEHVEASVFQVSRAPGKYIVYLGSLLLILGIFAMFYIRERRAWFWVKDGTEGGSHTLFAMSSARRTLDFAREYNGLKQAAAEALNSKKGT